jgi:hypothetical protein
MGLSLKSTTGQPQSVEQWVKEMLPEDRAALYRALTPHIGAASTGPVSLEKFRIDFSNLSKEDRMTFINNIREGIAIAHAAMGEEELDAALQAELDRRNEKAVNAAWAASNAGAKARRELAAMEAVSKADIEKAKAQKEAVGRWL